ncbi:putative zinc finger protein [Orchesella cincta]|uniref:Putative zinc finger protein n=1 Tax=Orchesella cincta TaxID=48709 RepID=A0A1D2NEM9_ORCCI|nr:putative zinc finger protein [Orchesella cincta]
MKSGAVQDDNSTGGLGGGSTGSSSTSYRNHGALSINSATDLSTSSSSLLQGVAPSQPGSSGSSFGAPKETGKGGRNTTSSSSSMASTTQDVCVGTSVGTITEPDCLGPCEPGTSVTLEGIVWHETESGVLVVNVTWRGKTYVGTLIDCTKNDWAPPRFCDSPTSDLEMRTPKNRGKRGRAQTATPVNEPVVADTRSANAKLRNGAKGRRGSNTATAFVAPASPVKPDTWPKRKTRGSENESQEDCNPKNAKRPKVSKDGDRKERRSNSPAADNEKSGPSSPQLIECPEPNCSKKYKHINGLRYHQSHAHSNNFVAAEDSDSNMSTASNTNASAPADPVVTGNAGDATSEPMEVDGSPDVKDIIPAITANSSSAPNSNTDENSLSAPPTPGKKSSTTPPAPSKVDDKVYDLSMDSDLNPSKDLNSQTQDNPESYKSIKSNVAKSIAQAKESSNATSDQDSKLVPENLSKDSVSTPSTPSTTTTPTPITPRNTILTVPVVPYMSLQSARNMAHGHVVNVPQKLGGSSKDKDKNNADQAPSKKNKHKKKSKDKDKDRDGKSKGGDKDKHESNSKSHNVSLSGASDYSRSSGLFHNSNMGSDSAGSRSKDMNSDDNEGSRKNSTENRDDPQSPAYSDISDANDSGPDAELNVGSAIKDTCKGLVIPPDIKKDPIVPGVAGGPPLSFFNHGFYSPYLDTPSNAPNAASRQPKDVPPVVVEEPEKTRPVAPKHPNLPPNSQPPPPSSVGNEEARRSPKMDFHSKYPFPNYFSYPYSGYHNPYEHPSFGNTSLVSDNSFNAGGPVRGPYPGMEERERDKESSGPTGGDLRLGNQSKNSKPVEKDEGPGIVQIKQEPVEREERSGKERPQSSSHPLNMVEDKNIEIKSEFGSDHVEPKLMPPYMSNSNSKHMSKEHKRDREREERDRDRHERRHNSKDDSKSDNIKSGRNSSSNNEKNKGGSEESEPKERKDEGSKPTMETTGPPPPPTASAYYLPQSYLPGNPFGLPFDPSHPLYRNVIVPGQYPVNPYMHPGSMPRFQGGGPLSGGPSPLPEDLSRPNPAGPGNPSKALDLLQHHAAQYYSAHKIHELQERALKSPSPQVAANQRDRDGGPGGPGSNLTPTPSSPGGHPLSGGPGVNHPIGGRSSVGSTSVNNSAMPKPADLSKDAKPTIGPGGTILPGGPNSDNVRTPPPTQHHVHSHTHHHTHVGIGYPIIPTVPPQYSPHYGVLATSPAAPSVIPPFPSQKPN